MKGIDDAIRYVMDRVGLKAVDPLDDVRSLAEIAVQRHGSLDQESLIRILKLMYGDSGFKAAKKALNEFSVVGATGMVSSVQGLISGMDWDNWTYGRAINNITVQGPEFRKIWDDAGLLTKGIQDTSRDRLANMIIEGVQKGQTFQETSKIIRSDIKTMSRLRAEIITITETNRAYNAMSLDFYSKADLDRWEWMSYSGACRICDSRGQKEYPLNAAYPPAHPSCRCAVLPVLSASVMNAPVKPTKPVKPTTPTPPRISIPQPVASPQVPVISPTPSVTITPPTPIGATSGIPIGPEAPAGHAFDFQSVQEATDWFYQVHGIKIDREVQDLITRQHINTIADAMMDADTKFPGIMKEVRLISWVSSADETSGTLASITTWPNSPNLGSVFSISRAKNELLRQGKTMEEIADLIDKMESSLGATNKKGWISGIKPGTGVKWGPSMTLKDVYTHEMGHVVQSMHRTTLYKRQANFLGKSAQHGKQIIKALRDSGFLIKNPSAATYDDPWMWNEDLLKYVGRYATTNTKEFHSEISVIFNHPEWWSQFPQEVQDALITFQRVLNQEVGSVVIKEEDEDSGMDELNEDGSWTYHCHLLDPSKF
jgi:SPP1 gp7 family putative phage head morphogenesis protein